MLQVPKVSGSGYGFMTVLEGEVARRCEGVWISYPTSIREGEGVLRYHFFFLFLIRTKQQIIARGNYSKLLLAKLGIVLIQQ